ncbi:hypothetical protein QLX67_10970, partial [Balneolaceae bacterium ANBcel3]|nr:hypothetical protein [Balneolaceae bacterium ANBcel3]
GARLHREHDLPGSTSSHLDVKNLVTLAGYKETDIDLYLVSEGRFSSVEIAKQFRENRPGTYWGEVQRNVLHSSDFFDRISDFPGFGTSEDLEKMKSVPWAPRHQRQWTPPEERRPSTPEFGVSNQSD